MTMQVPNRVLMEIPVNMVVPNPLQPRNNFEHQTIEELANSISAIGLIEPIVVQKNASGLFEIVAGERRWRAAKICGLNTITAIIENMTEDRRAMVSLVENVHRRELSHLEKARGVMQILKSRGISLPVPRLISILHKLKRSPIHTSEEEKDVLESIKLIGKHPATVLSWIQTLNVSPDILAEEEDKVDQLPGSLLARLSTIEDEDLQKEVYTKIVEDKNSLKVTPSKYISIVKRNNLRKNGNEEVGDVDSPPKSLSDEGDRVSPNSIDSYFDKEEDIESIFTDVSGEVDKLGEVTQTLTRHVDKIPRTQLYIERNNWNRQMFRKQIDFFTCGTDGKSIEQFIEIVKELSGDNLVVVDVRAKPYSRYKPAFNRGQLQAKLSDIQVDYKHIPELGVQRSLRNKLYSNEINENELWNIYTNKILTDTLKSEIQRMMENTTPIFLCTEISPVRCHRHLISQLLIDGGKLGFDL